MNKEELEKEAERHSKNYPFTICLHNGRIRKSGKQIAIENYIAGAKPREKRIAELEEQIEKMKCCENCKHPYWNAETEAEETVCDNCVNNSNWELAE